MAGKKREQVRDAASDIVAGGQRTAQPMEDEQEDHVRSFGVGLKASEWDRIEQIAAELGKKKHALAAWALKDFLKRYETGEIKPVEAKTLPGL